MHTSVHASAQGVSVLPACMHLGGAADRVLKDSSALLWWSGSVDVQKAPTSVASACRVSCQQAALACLPR